MMVRTRLDRKKKDKKDEKNCGEDAPRQKRIDVEIYLYDGEDASRHKKGDKKLHKKKMF